MILGNKCDMNDKRVVSTEAGEQLAEEYRVTLMETSAKSNINIEEGNYDICIYIYIYVCVCKCKYMFVCV